MQPASPRDGYPWAREREALEALDRLEVDRCRAVLRRLARDLRLPRGTPVTVATLLLSDLLGRLRRAARPEADSSQRERSRRARRLGTATDLEAARAAFLEEVDLLFSRLNPGAGLSPAVLRARSFLDHNYRRRLTLRRVADAAQLSPNYVSSLFRRETGLTVTQYLRGRRMRLAQKLLLDDRHNISEIAHQVGYQNYRDFHRNFVRASGHSPRAFQRACRAGRHSLEEGSSPVGTRESGGNSGPRMDS